LQSYNKSIAVLLSSFGRFRIRNEVDDVIVLVYELFSECDEGRVKVLLYSVRQ
jgi:hypothetical protein